MGRIEAIYVSVILELMQDLGTWTLNLRNQCLCFEFDTMSVSCAIPPKPNLYSKMAEHE